MKMPLDLKNLLLRAEREYLLDGKEEFQYRLPVSGITRSELEAWLAKHPFLRITSYRDVREGKAKVGWPKEVSFSLRELLARRPEVAAIRKAWDEAAIELAGIVNWNEFVRQNFAECLRKAGIVFSVAKVLRHLAEHRSEVIGLYPRQIPHGQSTKLIGYESLLLKLYSAYLGKCEPNWSDFYCYFQLRHRPVSFQFYADQISLDGQTLNNVRAILDEENAGRWGIRAFRDVLIVENEESFFPLHGQIPNVLLINGHGKRAASLRFLREYLPGEASIFYWGDIDKEGYEILSQVADLFSRVIPLCMDRETIKRYWSLKQPRERTEPQPNSVALLDEEYRMVCTNGIQIEQEQIFLKDIVNQFAEAGVRISLSNLSIPTGPNTLYPDSGP